jgi:Transposase IS116/IS110/IS902 family
MEDRLPLDRRTQRPQDSLRRPTARLTHEPSRLGLTHRNSDTLLQANRVSDAGPRTTRLLGISTGHTGQLLVTAGQNIERLRGEAAFASVCCASPVPASSGKTTRHRLNYGGDRQANRTLHLIAVCRLRYCPRTRAYAKRRTAEGKTKAEIMRCLKRYIAREAYNALRADLAASPHPTPGTTTTIYCGAGPIGIPRGRDHRHRPRPQGAHDPASTGLRISAGPARQAHRNCSRRQAAL